jgi:hypothetical protein
MDAAFLTKVAVQIVGIVLDLDFLTSVLRVAPVQWVKIPSHLSSLSEFGGGGLGHAREYFGNISSPLPILPHDAAGIRQDD